MQQKWSKEVRVAAARTLWPDEEALGDSDLVHAEARARPAAYILQAKLSNFSLFSGRLHRVILFSVSHPAAGPPRQRQRGGGGAVPRELPQARRGPAWQPCTCAVQGLPARPRLPTPLHEERDQPPCDQGWLHRILSQGGLDLGAAAAPVDPVGVQHHVSPHGAGPPGQGCA